MPGGALRGLAAVVLLVLGVAVGIAAVAVHATTVGLPLALLAGAATSYALPGGWWARLPFGLGWVLVVGVSMTQRGAGDYLIAADLRGYLLLGFTLLLLVFTIVTIRPRQGAPRRPPPRSGRAAS